MKFLLDNAFVKPKALLDPEVLMRITPTGGSDPLQGSNVKLLSQLLRPSVFNRMAEAKSLSPGKPSYGGIDMLKDLNQGLFSELKDGQPVIDFYRFCSVTTSRCCWFLQQWTIRRCFEQH